MNHPDPPWDEDGWEPRDLTLDELDAIEAANTPTATPSSNGNGHRPHPDEDGPRPFHRVTINLDTPPTPPDLINNWLYAGRLNTLQSEPGVGKSWLAAWIALQQIHDGHDVIYLDEEGGPELVHERLHALGGDPHAVRRHLWYYPFEGRNWRGHDQQALAELLAEIPDPTLAVLDSLPDILEAAGLSEDSATDVTRFVNSVLAIFRRAGAAQLVLDHLRKQQDQGGKKTRSRYSRGSGAKLAKADATLLLEAAEEFDARTSGRLKLWKTKDRRGRLPLPRLDKPPLEIVAAVDADRSTVDFQPVDPAHANEQAAWDGPTHCMAAVIDVLSDQPGRWLSASKILTELKARDSGFHKATVLDSCARLRAADRIRHRAGPRNADEYQWPDSDHPTTTDPFPEGF